MNYIHEDTGIIVPGHLLGTYTGGNKLYIRIDGYVPVGAYHATPQGWVPCAPADLEAEEVVAFASRVGMAYRDAYGDRPDPGIVARVVEGLRVCTPDDAMDPAEWAARVRASEESA